MIFILISLYIWFVPRIIRGTTFFFGVSLWFFVPTGIHKALNDKRKKVEKRRFTADPTE